MRFILAISILTLLLSTLSAQYIDWQYIDIANKNALDAMINDLTTDSKFTPKEHAGCFRSWKGNFNCTNYGVFMWLMDQTIRHDDAAGYAFIKQHVIHMTQYGFDFGTGPDPKFHHKPGGEGVLGHPVWEPDPGRPGKSYNWDSDIARHVHLSPYAYLLRLLKADPLLVQKIGLTAQQLSSLQNMVFDWADNWYMKIDWLRDRDCGNLFQYGRSMVPARGLIEMYRLTNQWKYLATAEVAFLATFYKLDRGVKDRSGNISLISYDTGYEAEQRTKRLKYFAAHFNMEPWQMGFMGETAAYLYYLTKNAAVKWFCAKVVLDVSDWVVKKNDIPMGDLTSFGSQDFIVSFLQGGNLVTVENTKNMPMMTPRTALNLSTKTPFLPLCIVRSHYWDGCYWTTLLPDKQPRKHYPTQLGVQFTVPNFYNWSDVLFARFYLTRNSTDLLWAIWTYRDAKYFANRSSVVDFRTLDKPDTIQYGGGNIGRTRGFAQWARGSLWSAPAIRHFDKALGAGRL